MINYWKITHILLVTDKISIYQKYGYINSAPDPAGGAYSAPPDPVAGNGEGPSGKGEGKGEELRGREGWGGEGWEGKGYPPNENPGYGLKNCHQLHHSCLAL